MTTPTLSPTAPPAGASPTRVAALLAGPLALVALASFIASIVATGGDALALATSPASILASLAGLASLIALTIGMGRLRDRYPSLHGRVGAAGWVVAAVGTVLAAGGQWTQLFVLPGLAEPAPDLAANGIGSVVAGYIASYVVLGIGWLIVGAVLLRSGEVRMGLAWTVVVGAVLCILPLPVRFVLLAIGVTLLERAAEAGRR